MNNRIKKIREKINVGFEKINTNSSAGMIYELILDFCLDEEEPYSKAKYEFSRMHDLKRTLLNKRNMQIYKGLQVAFAIFHSQQDIEIKLEKALNYYPEARKYYEYLYNAYNEEMGLTDSKVKVVKQKNKELVLIKKK